MTTLTKYLPDERATSAFAGSLATALSFPLVLTLSGEIGAGKTSFIRALLKALGVGESVKSPTFSLVESYQCQDLQIHHFDLYRIQEELELDYIGFRDYFTPNSFCCIEWPERAPQSLDAVDIHGSLTTKGSGRLMSLHALTDTGERILSCLAGEQ